MVELEVTPEVLTRLLDEAESEQAPTPALVRLVTTNSSKDRKFCRLCGVAVAEGNLSTHHAEKHKGEHPTFRRVHYCPYCGSQDIGVSFLEELTSHPAQYYAKCSACQGRFTVFDDCCSEGAHAQHNKWADLLRHIAGLSLYDFDILVDRLTRRK